MTPNSNNPEEDSENDPLNTEIQSFAILFLISTYLSIMLASSFGYILYQLLWPYFSNQGLFALLIILVIDVFLSYLVLVFGSWAVAKIMLYIITKGKPIKTGTFENSYESNDWKQFGLRHIVKKFSMWLFHNHIPRWLYRKYVGSFITIGKNVEIPEWVPMECAEIGDNTVFARQVILTSHLIDGNKINLKPVKVGKNCIIDSKDEQTRVGISCDVVIEDNVIVKPGTFVPKGTILKSGGIYQGDSVIERVGEVSDLSSKELAAYRKEVRQKRTLKSRMIDDWSSFSAKLPRVLVKLSRIIGIVTGLGIIAVYLLYAMDCLVNALGIFGHILNLLFLPVIFIIAYGISVYGSIPLIFLAFKRYARDLPKLSEDPGAELVITDAAMIERWKIVKWLKWKAVEFVNESLFPDTSMLVFQRIGDNDVAFRTVLYVSKIDPDYVSIGDNTLLSFGCHVYAYRLEEGQNFKLTIKRTSIGSNCILASSQIMAGAEIGDNVVLGCHTVVPEDAKLDSNHTYVGNPALEIKKFLEKRKELKKTRENNV